jgi:transcription initiation factor IIE alpha subunit
MEEQKKEQVVEEVKEIKKPFNFKEYYNSNPEFKLAHQEKMRIKMLCPDCGNLITKYALEKHKRSKKHVAKMEFLKNI